MANRPDFMSPSSCVQDVAGGVFTHSRSATAVLIAVATVLGSAVRGDDLGDLRRDLERLRQQNERLQQQLDSQQKIIGQLSEAARRKESETASPQNSPEVEKEAPVSSGLFKAPGGSVRLGAEGGFGLFHGRPASTHPNTDFRVDEARLFLEAKLWEDVYSFSEINLMTREQPDEAVELGELYVDFEDVSKLWGQERLLNLRAGRLDIPFGEEYLSRDAIDNPLVAHSVADFWGIDEGVELYGSARQVSYVVAVQNGGHPMIKDGTADKSLAVRLGWDPTRWLHGSVSLMRTGSLDVGVDKTSELWIGNGFFRALGPAGRTTRFHAELAQGDLRFLLPDGHVSVSGGAVRYDDNDPQQDNRRQLFHASAEVVQRFTRRIYAAARYSRILAPEGYPVAGLGTFGQYFSRTLSTDVWRATLGVGYRFSDNLVLKADYSFEGGTELGGTSRQRTDIFAAQIAIRY
jgi:hypothetical protein